MYGIEGLLAGRTLVDRYRIDEVIGRGGMGAVYRARDLRLNRAVAVKVISVAAPDVVAHERLRARFQREARAAAALHHPHVVAVYDYGTDGELGLDFLVMELLRGEDLATRLARKGPPALSTTLQILYQAARGLGAGHRAGLIHRDVKPGNLFLEPGDRVGEVQVRVLDFGIAEIAAVDGETMTHLTAFGRSPFSPAYASPEQLRGEQTLTPATDVFSLGAVGFQLLTGRRAFHTTDPREQIEQVAHAVATDLSRVAGLPTAVRICLERALAPSPADRFANAGAFAEAIGYALPSDPSFEPIAERPSFADVDRTLLVAESNGKPALHPSVEVTARPGTRFVTPVSRPPLVSSGPPPPREVIQFNQRIATSPPGISSASMRPVPRRGWVREAAIGLWNFLVTTVSFVLFGAIWLVAVEALNENDFEKLYLATASTVALTPFALHRLMGSRGSFRFALFASILASLATVYLLNDRGNGDIELVLAALFMAQLVAVILAEILTRRSVDEELEEELERLRKEAL
ncbi:MAG TPA: serine/threonine-protein kinase [Longimicrobiaceae bacterium]